MLTVILDPFTLRAIEKAKREPREAAADYPAMCEEIAKAGWAGAGAIEALFVRAGLPLAMCRFSILLHFGLEPELMFFRRDRGGDAFGFEHYPAAAIARFLIYARAIGLSVDPAPLVQPLAWSLRDRALLTEHELAVLDYPADVQIEVREAA